MAQQLSQKTLAMLFALALFSLAHGHESDPGFWSTSYHGSHSYSAHSYTPPYSPPYSASSSWPSSFTAKSSWSSYTDKTYSHTKYTSYSSSDYYHTSWESTSICTTSTYVPPPPSTTCTPSPTPTPKVPSLSDALIAAGCSHFLDFIKSDPTIWDLYNSPRVETVFAVHNSYFNFTAASLRRRALTPAELQKAELAAAKQQTDIAKQRLIPGTVIETNDDSANLNGSSQVVVSDSRDKVVSSPDRRSRLWTPSKSFARQDDTAKVKVASGLGDLVSVINPDVQYDGGLIQVTDGLFTPPEPATETAKQTNQNTFAALANSSADLSSLINNTPDITIFMPSDAAFAAAGITPTGSNSSDTAALIQGHVVQQTSAAAVGYLPNLVAGETLVTDSGLTLTVTVQGEDWYINGALISKANMILPNGVAHVVDKLLTPPKTVTSNGTPTICWRTTAMLSFTLLSCLFLAS